MCTCVSLILAAQGGFQAQCFSRVSNTCACVQMNHVSQRLFADVQSTDEVLRLPSMRCNVYMHAPPLPGVKYLFQHSTLNV